MSKTMSQDNFRLCETKIIFACTTDLPTLLKTVLCDFNFSMKLKLLRVKYTRDLVMAIDKKRKKKTYLLTLDSLDFLLNDEPLELLPLGVLFREKKPLRFVKICVYIVTNSGMCFGGRKQ